MSKNEKISPSNINAEKVVLASMMTSNNACKYGIETLDELCFYSMAHKRIFVCMKKIYHAGSISEPVALSEELQRAGWLESVGSEAYLSELTESVSSSSNIIYLCKILIEKAILRGCAETFYNGYEYTFKSEAVPETVLDTAEKRILQLRKRLEIIGGDEVYSHEEALQGFSKDVEEKMAGEKSEGGLRWPVLEMNNRIGRAQLGKIYLFCGFEKGGKSRFVRCCSSLWLDDNLAGVIILTEEKFFDVFKCIIAHRCRIDTKKIEQGDLNQGEYSRLKAEVARLKEQGIVIVKKPGISPLGIRKILERAQVQFIKSGKKLSFCIIDTVQKMKLKAADPNEMHEMIAAELAIINAEFNIVQIWIMQYMSETERGSRTKRSLQAYIRYGKVYRETADVITAFDDRRKNKKEREAEKTRGYRIVRAHITQREGESNICLDIKAELAYSSYGDRQEGDAAFDFGEEQTDEGGFFSGVDAPKGPDGQDLF